MAQVFPLSTIVGGKPLPPRRKRRQRILNYFSCSFCRISKVKCLPQGRRWPEEKCTRCIDKALACSAPHRKRTVPSMQGVESLPSLLHTHDAHVQYEQTKRGLLLLGLHAMTSMALEELQASGKDMLEPLMHDPAWKRHTKALESVYEPYENLTRRLRKEIAAMSLSHDLIISASIDINHNPLTLAFPPKEPLITDDLIHRYENLGHDGFACVLLIKRLVQHPDLVGQEASRLFKKWDQLSRQFRHILNPTLLHNDTPPCMQEHPFFIPSKLFKAGLAIDYMFRLERDCLGRSTYHLAHDAGCTPPEWGYRASKPDVLGRTAAYFACWNGDVPLLAELLDIEGDFSTPTRTGMSPLGIATVRGHTGIVESILKDQYKSTAGINPFSRDCSGRTFLDWAASCGNRAVVELVYANRYLWTNYERSSRILGEVGSAALRVAARSGQVDTVRCLLANNVTFNVPDEVGGTFSWHAAQRYTHEDMEAIIRVDPNNSHYEEQASLAETCKQGDAMAIDYLVDLDNHGQAHQPLTYPSNHGTNPYFEIQGVEPPFMLASDASNTHITNVIPWPTSYPTDLSSAYREGRLVEHNGSISEARNLGMVYVNKEARYSWGGS